MEKRRLNPKDLNAYQDIRQLMLSRQLVPGQKIIYRDLEELLGMSRTPINRALIRLEQENLVVSHHNRGYYVKKLTGTEVRQIFELKEKLQDILIVYAIARYQAEDLALLRRALDEYLAYKPELYDSRRFELDNRFHTQIAVMGGNDFLTSVLRQLYDLSAIGLNLFALTPLIPRFDEEHQAVFKAIEARNVKEAKKMLRDHDRAGKRALVEAMNK